MKRDRSHLLNRILFTAYLLAVWAAFFYLNTKSRSVALGILALCAAALFLAIPLLFRLIRRIRLPAPAKAGKPAVFAAAFLATAAVLAVWRWASWPGGFSPDSISQLQQAVSGQYDDWHPVWHTLVFFWLPVKLTGWTYSLFLFQDLVFCAAMAHTATVLYTYGSRRYALLSWCYVMLNPFVCRTAMFPWKDVGFSLAAMTSAALAMQVWCTRGESGRSPLRWAALGFALANAVLFRHNGVLFSGFLLAALAFTMKKGAWWKTALVFALTLALIRGPLYSALDVQKPGNRVTETMGLPLAVMGNVAKEDPEALDGETADFVYAIAPREEWANDFRRGDFNSMKWNGISTWPIEEAGVPKILRMTWHCFQRSPKAALDGLIDLTDLVYGLDGSLEGEGMPYISGGQTWFVRENNVWLQEFIKLYMTGVDASPLRYLVNIGSTMALVLGAMLARCDLRKWEDWKRILLALSMFCYNFGTMLLLTGPDSRFFLESFLVCPIFVLLMLYDRPPLPAPAEDDKGESQ